MPSLDTLPISKELIGKKLNIIFIFILLLINLFKALKL